MKFWWITFFAHLQNIYPNKTDTSPVLLIGRTLLTSTVTKMFMQDYLSTSINFPLANMKTQKENCAFVRNSNLTTCTETGSLIAKYEWKRQTERFTYFFLMQDRPTVKIIEFGMKRINLKHVCFLNCSKNKLIKLYPFIIII